MNKATYKKCASTLRGDISICAMEMKRHEAVCHVMQKAKRHGEYHRVNGADLGNTARVMFDLYLRSDFLAVMAGYQAKILALPQDANTLALVRTIVAVRRDGYRHYAAGRLHA